MMKAWLKQPVKRVHILLDRKGKTQSHAFVEMRDEDAARAALRTAQNSVLGKGKRARGVTVTRSSQDELMKALFPTWRGTFDGTRPSMRSLSDTEQISALSSGILDDSELKALLHLIRSPDSHFLKVPSLPFHLLISILDKFPVESEHGRQFYTSSLRDLLFDVTLASIRILASEEGAQRASGDGTLLAEVLQTAIHCGVFTPTQRSTLHGLVDVGSASSNSPSTSVSGLSEMALPEFATPAYGEWMESAPTEYHRPQRRPTQHHAHTQFNALAREFQCDPSLIEAVAARLASGELV